MTEAAIQKRMIDIIDAYSALPQFDSYALSLEAIGTKGDVKVVIRGKTKVGGFRAIKTIPFSDDLKWIGDTFDYPMNLTPNSNLIASDSVKMAYFNQSGYLIVEHEDSMEMFKVQPKHKSRVIEILKRTLGVKLKNQI